MNDIFSLAIAMPLGVQGLVATTPEGDYQIILNAAYSFEKQREIFNHEMRHVLLGHYQQALRPLHAQEAEADDKMLILDKIKTAEKNGLPLISGLLRNKSLAAPSAYEEKPPQPARKLTSLTRLENMLQTLQTLDAEVEVCRLEKALQAERYQDRQAPAAVFAI
ncbi:hypothetical protein LJC61_03900 [Ruminococcaceae bacterium OttesenSCG-928-A16]|nr:hypothetical protein [Ruminococcaceae bacterium OttesenSCG-928-A16]